MTTSYQKCLELTKDLEVIGTNTYNQDDVNSLYLEICSLIEVHTGNKLSEGQEDILADFLDALLYKNCTGTSNNV